MTLAWKWCEVTELCTMQARVGLDIRGHFYGQTGPFLTVKYQQVRDS